MALKDIFHLFDDKLEATFKYRGYDPADDRAKLVKRIEATRDKFLQTEPPRGKKDFQVANNVVAYSPLLPGGQPMVLNGKTTNHIPAERFAEVLDKLVVAVEAGELDKELEAAHKGEGTAGQGAALPKVRKSRQARPEGSTGKREWTPERKAKFAATIAARKAAKAG